MKTLFTISILFAILLSAATVRAQRDEAKPEKLPENGIKLGKPHKQKWQVGVIIKSPAGPCAGLFGTVPVPTDWPEQSVKVVAEEMSPAVGKTEYRTLDGGVKQLVFEIPQIPAGQEAKAMLTFEIIKHEILPPDDTTIFVLPTKLPKDLQKSLSQSPGIENRQPKIIALAKELLADKKEATAWEQVEALYDGVRAKVSFRNGPPKGAMAALKEGNGDFEDLTGLFVAVCRATKIPARTVWVQGGGYAEFYLQDKKGVGHWIPCQMAGAREFGGIRDPMPILQKGDNFKVPEKKEAQRFVAEFLKAGAATSRPDVNFVRNVLPGD